MPSDRHTFHAWRDASHLAADAERRLSRKLMDPAWPYEGPSPDELLQVRLLRERSMALLNQLMTENASRCRLLAVMPARGMETHEH